ncbi:MAG: inorganic diphosphatase [Candidatus Desulforudis sp.]|nr:inorganic diphosphatase [Desulforudis sp.]
MPEHQDPVVEAVIEIPRGSSNKYEYDRRRGVVRLDRVLYSPVHYPTDYGFIPRTLAEDGDELDIMVMISTATFPGCLVEARVLGALEMIDEKGRDIKILSAAVKDPRMDRFHGLRDVDAHRLREIEYFFTVYKDLEEKETLVRGWRDLDFTLEVMAHARDLYPRVTDPAPHGLDETRPPH